MSQSRNVQIRVVKNVLTITIDLSQNLGPSSTGKTDLVASTGGAIKLDGGISVALNAFKPRSAQVA